MQSQLSLLRWLSKYVTGMCYLSKPSWNGSPDLLNSESFVAIGDVLQISRHDHIQWTKTVNVTVIEIDRESDTITVTINRFWSDGKYSFPKSKFDEWNVEFVRQTFVCGRDFAMKPDQLFYDYVEDIYYFSTNSNTLMDCDGEQIPATNTKNKICILFDTKEDILTRLPMIYYGSCPIYKQELKPNDRLHSNVKGAAIVKSFDAFTGIAHIELSNRKGKSGALLRVNVHKSGSLHWRIFSTRKWHHGFTDFSETPTWKIHNAIDLEFSLFLQQVIRAQAQPHGQVRFSRYRLSRQTNHMGVNHS